MAFNRYVPPGELAPSDRVSEHETTLAGFLRARAIATPPVRLALDFVGGALVAAAALWARPVGWAVLTSAGLCLAMYGAWAVSERRLQADSSAMPVVIEFTWLAVRLGAAVCGLGALAALLMSLLGLALGTWIS